MHEPGTAPEHSVGVTVLLAELVAAIAVGAALWLGFRWLWVQAPVVAVVFALVVTGLSVIALRQVHRVRDMASMLLAARAGFVVTLSPAVLILVRNS